MRRVASPNPRRRSNAKHLVATIVVLVVALVNIAGCGGGSSSSGSSSSSSDPKPPESSPAGSKAPSRQFMVKGSENKWATFGEVASDEEREAASKVLAQNLSARQAGEWKAQCSSLTRQAMRELAPKPGTGSLVEACAKALKSLAEPLQASVGPRKDNLRGEIDILRVRGDRAVALFHGPGGKDYGMSLEQEDGEWKVAAVLTAQLN